MKIILLTVFVLILSGCIGQTNQSQQSDEDVNVAAPEDLSLTTTDNVKITTTYYYANGTKSIILLHSLGHDKSDWKDFALELQKKGYTALAIDLRGHGASELNWRTFTDSDFNRMMFDVIAAGNYLKSQDKNDLSIIGSSIGANLAVLYANTEDSKTTVLLSPGLNYRGINIESSIRQLTVPSIIIVGEKDSYSASSVKTISEVIDIPIKMYPTDKHGVDLLSEGDVKEVVFKWLEDFS